MNKEVLDFEHIDQLIQLAIYEDFVGPYNDAAIDSTTQSVIGDSVETEAFFLAKQKCVVAGLEIAERVFKTLSDTVEFTCLAKDGDIVEPGTDIAKVSGNAIFILGGERIALNFLQKLSAIATMTQEYVKELKGDKTKILDTRKTTPGWRSLEKYAVTVGGGENHRLGLYDRVMIKDNHRSLAGLEGPGSILRSVDKARAMFPQLEVEVEADTLDEVREAVEAEAEHILLDNMTNEEMAEAVKINNGVSKLEASGGITIERIKEIEKIGVDYISVGALTHSVKAVDISLEIR